MFSQISIYLTQSSHVNAKNTDQAVSTSSKKWTECTDKNNANINVEVSTTHESTNRAVDTNPEETTSNSAPCKEIPR